MFDGRAAHPGKPEQAAICQLARMGDLIQCLPLISQVCRHRSLTLICDRQTEEWARLLPGVASVIPVDTQQWRSAATGHNLPLERMLAEITDLIHHLDVKRITKLYPLNDHPVIDSLAGALAPRNSGIWLNVRLVLARSYLRAVVHDRQHSRIHLADLWQLLTDDPLPPGPPEVKSSHSGIQFAKIVLQPFFQAGLKRIWAFILGSGEKYRRLTPEFYSALWQHLSVNPDIGLVLIGGKGEEALAEAFFKHQPEASGRIVDLVGRCSADELVGVLGQLDLVLGVDTGPLHWAAAAGARVFGFYFGNAGVHDTGPYGSGHFALTPACEDYPCSPERAARCTASCTPPITDIPALARLLDGIDHDQQIDVSAIPAGYVLYHSTYDENGQSYHPFNPSLLQQDIKNFEIVAQNLIKQRNPFSNSSCQLDNTNRKLLALWMDQIVQLPLPKTVSKDVAQQVKNEALAVLRRAEVGSLSSADRQTGMDAICVPCC